MNVGFAASEGPKFSILKDRDPVEFGAYVVFSTGHEITRISADAELTAKLHTAELFTEFGSVAEVDTEHDPLAVVDPTNDELTNTSKMSVRSDAEAVADFGRAPTVQVRVVVPVQTNPRGVAVTLSGTRNVKVALGASSGPALFANTNVIGFESPGAIVPGPVTESIPTSAQACKELEKACVKIVPAAFDALNVKL